MKKYRVVERRDGFFYTQELSTERCGFLWLKHRPCWKDISWTIGMFSWGINRTLKEAEKEIADLIKHKKKFANGDIIHEINQ